MKTVIFSHGKESGPNGTKIQILSKIATEMGFSVISTDYRNCADVTERVSLLAKELGNFEVGNIILVGSSMGGYVSTVVASQQAVRGLFLMCPALYMPNYPTQSYAPKSGEITIIHGWKDSIVPYESSVRFAQSEAATLHLVNDGHRLAESHQDLQVYFSAFLTKINQLPSAS